MRGEASLENPSGLRGLEAADRDPRRGGPGGDYPGLGRVVEDGAQHESEDGEQGYGAAPHVLRRVGAQKPAGGVTN